VVTPKDRLKLKMKGGMDPCKGTTAEIGTVNVRGSSFRDTLTLDRNHGLDGARLGFQVGLKGGRDTLRLLGTKDRDRIRMSRFESSSPWIEVFQWKRVGGGRIFDVERTLIKGRGHDDSLVGSPSRPFRPRFSRSTNIRLRINAGVGSDRVIGGRRGDSLWGGSGDDFLRGGRGSDALRAGPGNDYCLGGPGDLLITSC